MPCSPAFHRARLEYAYCQRNRHRRVQANRFPDRHYRTTPLKRLLTRIKGGFYHNGHLPTLSDVVEHYNRFLRLSLAEEEAKDLIEYIEYLKSLQPERKGLMFSPARRVFT
jgi:cytochrome c peroxidase